MAVVTRVRRLVANPQRRKKKARRNPSHRRRMTAKQIKFFGSKRQKAALKAHRRRKAKAVRRSVARRVATVNPRRKVRARRRKAPARKRRSVNPALLVTLGAVNPRGGSQWQQGRDARRPVRASNPRRRRRNATRVVVTAPRRRNRRTSHRRRSVARRRNPAAFGLRGAGMAKAIVAGMAGMAAAKFIPTLIPGQFVQGNLMRTVATGASAFVAQMIAKAVVKDPTVSDAVLFGGLIQTGSVALNAFLPAHGSASRLGGHRAGGLVDPRESAADFAGSSGSRSSPIGSGVCLRARLNRVTGSQPSRT